MRVRLARWGLTPMVDLRQADPLQLCAAWGNVTGAWLWYALLHGYTVEPPRTPRRSIDHGRVLPPGAGVGVGRRDPGAAAGREGGPAHAAAAPAVVRHA